MGIEVIGERYRYCWKNNEKRKTLHNRVCTVLKRGGKNSVMIRFEDDSSIEIVSRYSLRKVENDNDIHRMG